MAPVRQIRRKAKQQGHFGAEGFKSFGFKADPKLWPFAVQRFAGRGRLAVTGSQACPSGFGLMVWFVSAWNPERHDPKPESL